MPNQDNKLPGISDYIRDQVEVSQRHLLLPTSFVATIIAVTPTFSVKNLTRIQLQGSAPQNVTYFDNGQEGQELVILGDGQVTLIYDTTKIITNTTADKLLVLDTVYTFYMFKHVVAGITYNVWFEK